MTATEAPEEEITKKSSKLPMIIGVFLAVAGGGGGFFAAQSGMLPFGESSHAAEHEASATHDEKDGNGQPMDAASDVSFVPIDPLLAKATAGRIDPLRDQVSSTPALAAQLETLKAELDLERALVLDVALLVLELARHGVVGGHEAEEGRRGLNVP